MVDEIFDEQAVWLDHNRCFGQSDNLRLFRVENKAKRSIDVLAVDARCARKLAWNNGHVTEEKNATVFRYTEDYIQKLKASGTAMGRAIRGRDPGVLRQIGTGVVIERAGKVFVPLTVVGN